MTRAVVNVATDSWVKGQARLMASPFLGEGTTRVVYHNCFPAGGLLLIPEASSGCTCDYPLQTTIVYAPAAD